ncbi:expressed unknown protein [Seminavis robusta]|uniref:Uncharacterized protein n=1 Tax=Seminavis robusta TaxID=568900 RepID=A0A9N8D9K6_9STRA|nr:expressed unknown protein [Seminavis robusta]|eukprot:Sro25_g016800.1 n/a (644) ;mRNA; r:36922-38853
MMTGSAAEDMVVTNFSLNSNSLGVPQNPTQPSPSWVSSWQQTANQLAYAPYSQYRVSEQEYQSSLNYQQQQQQSSSTQADTTSSRHFNWDDLGEEPKEDEEEMEALRERQRREQHKQWEGERRQHEEQLSNLWQSQPSNDAAAEGDNKGDQAGELDSRPTEADLSKLSWMDYWMPPHPSPLTECTYGLPSTSAASSLEAPPLHAFNIASHSGYSKTILEDFWEKIRHELERMDACQGFSILTEGSGIYAGMTDWVLQELQQECRAAGRWVFHVAEGDDHDQQEEASLDAGNQENASPRRRSTELSRAQARVRGSVQGGLALAGLSDHSHVMVPLTLPSRQTSVFRATAELAMALETVTLPYRCQSSSDKTLVGWNSMSGYEEGASPGGMTMGDYLTSLQPSPRYSLLELDAVMTSENRQGLGQSLVAGTSVERDPRMRRPQSSMSTEYPGVWLFDAQYPASPGLLTSLSPRHVAKQDRSLHHHYGLSTCLRRAQSSGSPSLNDNQQHLTCLMEGMGIRYRPETAFGLVCHQDLNKLTCASHRYGAGSYWQYLMGAGVEIPVLSVLGNTTRMYPHLHAVASQMKSALRSSKTKGFYQREVMTGTLPEVDDCDEALEQCWDLRDVYEPPNGSGLDEGEGGQYLDE